MIKITLKIDGLMCGMCESHINDVIRRELSVKKVTSSHSKGETVILSELSIDENKIRNVIDKTGYKVLEIKSEEYSEKSRVFGKLFSR